MPRAAADSYVTYCIGTWTVLSTPQSSLKWGISLFQTINLVRGLGSQFRFFSSHLNCLGTPCVEVQAQHVQGGEQVRSQRGLRLRGWQLWAHFSTVRQAAASAVSRLSGSVHQQCLWLRPRRSHLPAASLHTARPRRSSPTALLPHGVPAPWRVERQYKHYNSAALK